MKPCEMYSPVAFQLDWIIYLHVRSALVPLYLSCDLKTAKGTEVMATLRVDNIVLNGEATRIFCRDGHISEIGGDATEADEVLDGRGMTVLPPLLNAHTHASMTLFRGNGDDLPLMEWLQTRVWPYEEKITADEIYWGARLAGLEMIRSGCTFFNDMYWDFGAVARAVEETGIRACLSAVFIDFGDPDKSKQQRAGIEQTYKTLDQYSNRIQFAVSPHAIYTVSEDSLRWAAAFSLEHNVLFHTHLAETHEEVVNCQQEHGCSPVEYIERIGALNERTLAAHTVWLTESDIRLLGEHKVVCAHNPVSNMKLAVGETYPYRKLRDAGAITALATDGAGSNNNLDMFEDMKIAALLQKYRDSDPTSLPAVEAWRMATHNPAAYFGLTGSEIHVGREADFILVDLARPEMNPPHDLYSHLVYAANGTIVDSVVCDGRVLMKHREIEGEDEVIAKANEAAITLFERIDKAK
ncbi:amidohydrolase family protein [bacterium]|nr:amidohydrolase family protein [bacterium]